MEKTGFFDTITTDDLKALSTAEGPKVSLFLPTSPAEHTAQQTATRIKSLLTKAKQELGDNAGIIEPLDSLSTDSEFLRTQGESLAIFAADGITKIFRLGLPLDEHVAVADHFILRPISEALTESHAFYILALSQNKVRIFDATKDSYVQLDLGDTVPESLDDVVDTENRQTQIQNRNVGGGTAMFHGQGGSDKAADDTEKFLHAVASSLGDLLGRARSQPMVVASVAEALPTIKASSSYPVIVDEPIAGNPDNASGAQLQKAGWDVIMPRFRDNDDAAYQRFADVAGTGRGETQPDLIRQAAVEGRVDTLFINPSLNASDGTGDVNTAILNTVLNSGKIVIISDGRVDNVAALMRY